MVKMARVSTAKGFASDSRQKYGILTPNYRESGAVPAGGDS